jgi:hypothetical protein
MRGIAERPIDRLMRRVDKQPDGCWNWTGHVDAAGYGHTGGKAGLAHRALYECFAGPIPDGLTIDHLCRNRRCVNPGHLEAVSMRENVLRGDTLAARKAQQTHCVHDHEFTAENTYVKPNGTRDCRACKRARDQKKAA